MSLKWSNHPTLQQHAGLSRIITKKFYNICFCSFDPEKRNPKTKAYSQFGFINCSD